MTALESSQVNDPRHKEVAAIRLLGCIEGMLLVDAIPDSTHRERLLEACDALATAHELPRLTRSCIRKSAHVASLGIAAE